MLDDTLKLAPASVFDYRELAFRKLPRQFFDYIDGGAYDEYTLRRNVEAFREVELRQRVLRDVSSVDLSTMVLGQQMSMPLILAPVGLAGAFAKRAEVQAAKAAQSKGVVFCESTVSICSIEEVAEATNGPLWFQLYVMRDREYTKALLERAHAAGCKTLLLTVDLAVVGARYRDTRNGLLGEMPLSAKLQRAWDIVRHTRWLFDVGIGGRPLTFGNLENAVPNATNPAQFKEWIDSQFDPSVTWDDIAWVRENWPGTLVLKGIMDADDARLAVQAGVDGIVVSNHGGRQLDHVPATIEVLPEIKDAVGDQLAVLVVGGIRSGNDVLKTIALGADACLIGRAWAWAVAAAGEQGVAHVLTTIADEMRVAMALTATTSVQEIDRRELRS
ncbi:MAG: L-lactate dehydrogenase [Polyangiales bacterium]